MVNAPCGCKITWSLFRGYAGNVHIAYCPRHKATPGMPVLMYKALRKITSGPCCETGCETEGCSDENPRCDVSRARAALALLLLYGSNRKDGES
jgi:hypothetical protein